MRFRHVVGNRCRSRHTARGDRLLHLHRRLYSVYWDLFTPAEWDKKAAELVAERERQRKREAATVSFAQPGETQSERDFNQQ